MKTTKPWSEYPVGTVVTAIDGGHWYKTERGYKWNGPDGTGSTFPTPGGDWSMIYEPSDMTADELQRIALRLANQAWVRYWLHYNDPIRIPWEMAIQVMDWEQGEYGEFALKEIRVPDLDKLGFRWDGHKYMICRKVEK